MHEVSEAVTPEFNDEFEKFGVTEGGESSFREEVKKNMGRELEAAIKNQIKQQVMDNLSKVHDFLLPHDVVQRDQCAEEPDAQPVSNATRPSATIGFA